MLGTKLNVIKKEPKEMQLDPEMESSLLDAEMEEDAMKQELLPGRFSQAAINNTLKPLMAFFKSLGISDFETLEAVSEDVISPDIASAILAAVEMLNSAIAAEVLDENMSVTLEDITDDAGLSMLSSRLMQIARNKRLAKELKAFLESAETEEPAEVVPAIEEDLAVDSDALMMSRIS